MKKLIYPLLIATFVSLTVVVSADPPPPPPGNPSTGGGGAPVGAPIDGGLIVLIALGAVYSAIKLYQVRKVDLGKD